MAWIALALTAETVIFAMAGFAWFRSMGYTFAEAGAGAVVSLFVVLSLVHQFCMFIGSPWPAYILECAALAAILFFGRRWLPQLSGHLASATGMLRREALSGLTLAGGWAVMAGLLAFGWLSADYFQPVHPWNELIAGWKYGGLGRMAATDPIPVLNTQALFFHTARFGLGPNACGFGLLAHMAVGFSTYALARRYGWPAMALTVTLMVLSMPRLVFLGLWPSSELVSSAAIAFGLVLIYRLIEQHQPADLRMFLLCILFSIDSHPTNIALVPVMVLLLLVVMIRRHGWLLWREMATANPFLTALALLPALGLAQIPAGVLNLANGHPLFGSAVAVDNVGILGAAANLVRYIFISVDPTEPIRQMLAWLVGIDLNRLLVGIYNTLVAPIFGYAGVQASFYPVLSGSSQMGFGPFACLLVLPAMIHALMRGPRRLKALCVAWGGYLYLAALLVNWQPGNIAFLSPLFAANGFVVAFSLPPWRLRRRGMRLLQVDFAILFAWSIARAGWPPG